MALQAPIVTVSSIVEPQERLFITTFHLTVGDDELGYNGISQDFPVKSKIPDYSSPVAVDESEVIKQMQAVIDAYESIKDINKGLVASVSNIQAGLVVT